MGEVLLVKRRMWQQRPGAVTAIQLGTVLFAMAAWQSISLSGIVYEGVMPSLHLTMFALLKLLAAPALYKNALVTALEIIASLAIGGLAGVVTGIFLGGSRFATRAYEPFLYYLGPTPKIVFFPLLLMMFGVGNGSKVAMGTLSCFFPIALSAAAGMRGIEPILIKVARSLDASPGQMVMKVYLPAIREPILNGFRLGLGVATIGVLLGETKISNQGLGFMIVDFYRLFDMPSLYALIFLVFCISIGINTAMNRLETRRRHQTSKGGLT